MASTLVDTCIGDTAADVYQKATHLADEARAFTNLAGEAVETGVHAAKRAFNRSVESAGDLRDRAVYRVKRNPIKAVGLAFGAGLLLGAVVGAFGGRRRD
jgi:ElaB/YqjD/DUF883 family membrane-anchored ribosome-binding protein